MLLTGIKIMSINEFKWSGSLVAKVGAYSSSLPGSKLGKAFFYKKAKLHLFFLTKRLFLYFTSSRCELYIFYLYLVAFIFLIS